MPNASCASSLPNWNRCSAIRPPRAADLITRRAALAGFLLLVVPGGSHAAPARWDRFTAILWQSDLPPPALAGLGRLGITAGRVFGQRGRLDPAALRAAVAGQRQAGLRTMVENVATDFYSAYHRWRPGLPVNAAFVELLARHRAHPDDDTVWRRNPGLADPAAFATVQNRLAAHARVLARAAPLYISLGDETGIADLSAASDLDQGEPVLRGWRRILRLRYRSIRTLNRAWHAAYSGWNAIRPTGTDAAIAGTAPVAGWLDFKAWMDATFAQAVRTGAMAVHAGDPHGLAAIEGVQLPGWGGYDYATLSPAVDVMEAGQPDPSYSLARSFNPRVTLLTTVPPEPGQAHRLWRSVLLGGRGAVIWDADGSVVRPDGTPGPGGTALAPVLAGLRGPLGTLLLAARARRSGVGVLYSQVSFRMRWLLDRRRDAAAGRDWTTRDNDEDLADSPWRNALMASAAALDHLGLHPHFLDAATLTPRTLAGLRTILLPHALVLDDAAVASLRRFAAAGGTIVADTEPGQYDGLGRPRGVPPLAGIGARVGRLDTVTLRGALYAPPVVTALAGMPRDDVGVFRFSGGPVLALQPDDAGGAGPAMVTVAGRRCPVTLAPAVPTVLLVRAGGIFSLQTDGTPRRLECRSAAGSGLDDIGRARRNPLHSDQRFRK